jgi:hypothetical protein
MKQYLSKTKSIMSLSKERICQVEIEDIENSVFFQGNTYKIRAVRTCYGDFLVYVSSCSSILTASQNVHAAYDHFKKVSKRCVSLRHNGILLSDQIKVINCVVFINFLNLYCLFSGPSTARIQTQRKSPFDICWCRKIYTRVQ